MLRVEQRSVLQKVFWQRFDGGMMHEILGRLKAAEELSKQLMERL